MFEIKVKEAIDGRRLRSERSVRAIIEAALALQAEGMLVPTAQQISDRAGVGIRSFFRHFEDMESLFAAVDAQIRDSYESLFLGGERDGSVDERIERAVIRRSEAFESVNNVVQGTLVLLWRYEILRKHYARNQRGLRKDLENWLPEVKKMERGDRESIHAIASFEMWHRLRYHQGLTKQASINIVLKLLRLQLVK
jgi:AcrR family transcriptional regulator